MSTIGSSRPSAAPSGPYRDDIDPLHRHGDWLWIPLKGEWRIVSQKPEEVVRQQFIHRLHTEYGYALNQLDQERRTIHGHTSPRADIVVCRDADALRENRDYVIVAECKSDDVKIIPSDFSQGESYARAVGCEFLVLHNTRESRFFRLVPGAPGQRIDVEDIPNASDIQDPARLEAIRRASKAFSRDEFRRLLSECHDILRNNHKMEPGQAFDEISKILFIKMWIERSGYHERFTQEYLRQYARFRRRRVEDAMDDLFDDTKCGYHADDLFDPSDRLNISFETFKRIVDKLERFNLSATGEDVKGIAFERFLGQTFRGELGQFFTPRPIVDFMVEMLDPKEGEIICDPASGSGGFLIKCFEYVRSQIEADIISQKEIVREENIAKAAEMGCDEEEQGRQLDAAFHDLNFHLDVQDSGSRLHKVAHDCILGVDAEKRAARTSKMNMIMHGDGHGGIHYHDGLLDTNGIFPDRFDVVLTNPPFGSTVGKDQIVGDTEQTRVTTDSDQIRAYENQFGEPYTASRNALLQAERDRDSILKLFDIGREPLGGDAELAKVRNSRDTEMLFLERCLKLLKPGGRMGIVLPEGILNNPSNQWLRDYCIGRAKLLAVVSIPQEVFASADATVKTSIVFLQRFTRDDENRWNVAGAQAQERLLPVFEAEREALETEYELSIRSFDRPELREIAEKIRSLEASQEPDVRGLSDSRQVYRKQVQAVVTDEDRARQKELRSELARRLRDLEHRAAISLRARAKELFDYPIFAAEVGHAGITATGDTGDHVPNELPSVVTAYREFLRDPAVFAAQTAEEKSA